ncbi:type II secretion system protein [Geminisphaera colitermitum]|uniref:type II secretion system protein n=1 Tax=Geminisphaera colitermitum TaxID=1148786 RepID=UPI0001964D45|nr:prepilin-type N-terminal cleavage/methylation domain-containing protein [Geminisphaera colitermitum]
MTSFFRPPLSRAFTLIELLAVIVIIGLLAAIIIPVVGVVRATAHTSVCSSNLRQLAMACNLYAQDNNGKFPSTRLYNSGNRSDGNYGVLEYVGNSRLTPVYRCPSLKNYPFGPEHILPGTETGGCTYTASLTTSNNANGGGIPLVYVSQVEIPSRTAWIMDGVWEGTYFYSVIGRNELKNRIAQLQFPHKGRQNVVFVDIHVEAIARDKFPADPTATFWTSH